MTSSARLKSGWHSLVKRQSAVCVREPRFVRIPEYDLMFRRLIIFRHRREDYK
jgi:hypothetical protein